RTDRLIHHYAVAAHEGDRRRDDLICEDRLSCDSEIGRIDIEDGVAAFVPVRMDYFRSKGLVSTAVSARELRAVRITRQTVEIVCQRTEPPRAAVEIVARGPMSK
ncbi:hypothetical protein, partial [Streptomyces beigongshangae]|uniref:hypothetical protein n=1 Tax=Streptomyces beigongshangae TaxID=2841597 RepID=UPI001C8565A6